MLAIVVAVLHHVHAKNAGSLLAAAAVFGVLNTVLKPILKLITLPAALLSLGLAWFGVSMLMLVLTRDIVKGFHIHGFTTLLAATLIIWLVNLVLDFVPGPWRLGEKRQRKKK